MNRRRAPLLAVTIAALLACQTDERAPSFADSGAPPPDLRFSAPKPIDSDVFPLEVRRIVVDPGHARRRPSG